MNLATVQSRWRDAKDFKDCAREWAERIGVHPRRIQIQQMTRKWASCSSSGVVTFSAELISGERNFGEAVIVHELIHLKVRNHGSLFRSLFRAYLPHGEALLSGHLRGLD